MKLYALYEAVDKMAFVKRKVLKRIKKGDSRLKKLLKSTDLTLDNVIYAIKKGECISNPASDAKALGPTYLEQTVSHVLRDLVKNRELPVRKLNDVRKYFGLVKLNPKELHLVSYKASL